MENSLSFQLNDGMLTVYACGKLDSINAPLMQKELETITKEQPHSCLILDLSHVDYISSTGLRTLLSCYKSEKLRAGDSVFFRVEGVQPQVYEILEMTGFTEMFPVSKGLRRISLEGAEPVGGGFFSTVYRINSEDIVKVYNDKAGEVDIRRELQMAKYALLLGLPTAISYDIVEADGHKGVIFEQMNCGTLRDAVNQNPERIENYILQYTELLKQIHATSDREHWLPDVRDQLNCAPELLKNVLTASELVRLRALIDSLPDCEGMVHGDCQVKNIMLHNNELLLIDLDTLSRGSPVVELGNIYFTYTCFEEIWPGNSEEFLGLTAERAICLRDGILKQYLAGVSQENFDADMNQIRMLGWLRMLGFLVSFRPSETDALEHARNRLREYLPLVDTLELSLPNTI